MNEQMKSSPRPGEARSSGPSVQQILDSDGDDPPKWYREQSYQFIGDKDLDAERYTSKEFHDLEMERMWTRVWQMACREEEIPEVGDHIVYDIGDHSFIIAHTAEDEFKAYYNACLHRGTQLRQGEGHAQQFRCPFHGWTWALDGTLKEVPCRWDFPHVKDTDYTLPEAKLDRWGGFVFINMDPDCAPLSDYLGVLPEHFQKFPLENRYMTANVRRVLPCNWKVAQEAFIESYHVVETHSQALPFTGDANTQYDIYGDRVSRLYTTTGVPSPHVETPADDQALAQMLLGFFADGAEGPTLQEGETARTKLAEAMRAQLGAAFQADLTHLSTTEVIDSIEYFLFPNFFPWFNFSLPLVYRFRPNGSDPDSSIMDVMLLYPVPDEGPRPDPAPLNILRPDQPFTDAPELAIISEIFEQDVSNMGRVQQGLKALQKGVTLGNYQEIRIRHMHRTLDSFLTIPKTT